MLRARVSELRPLRILLADPHELFRDSLAALLATKPGVGAVEGVGTLTDVATRIDAFQPDVLLLDLQMERPATPHIPTFAARTAVMVVTATEELDQLLGAVRAGARAIVPKTAPVATLMEALRAVTIGEVWLSRALQSRLVGELADSSSDRLTIREREIVRLVALGMRNAEVATELYISAITVKTHLSRIFDKLGIRDRADLVLFAVRTGLISVNEKKPERSR
jgi:DNA-binding NarL/FixJ family response regulator